MSGFFSSQASAWATDSNVDTQPLVGCVLMTYSLFLPVPSWTWAGMNKCWSCHVSMSAGNTQTCLTECSRGFWVKILLAWAQVPSRTIRAAPSPATPSGSCGILVCSTATEQSECVHHLLWSIMTSLQPLFSASPLLLHFHSQYYIMKVEKHFAAFHFLVLHFAGRLSEGSWVYLWLTFGDLWLLKKPCVTVSLCGLWSHRLTR